MKCLSCGKTFKKANWIDGMPNGMTFVLQSGKQITVCRGCIIKIGMMNDTDKNEYIKSLEAKATEREDKE